MYTTENFWCPHCGRLPLQMGHMYCEPGLIGGWTTLTCRQCGRTDGDIACRGEADVCVVLPDGFCRFHGNFVGEHPHPHGQESSRARSEKEFAAPPPISKKIVTLAIVCFRRHDLLASIVRSAESGIRVPDRYLLVDNGGNLNPSAHGFPEDKTSVIRPGRNLGTTAAWNAIFDASDDYTIVSSDDSVMHTNTISALVDAAETTTYKFFYATPGMFGVFLARRALLDEIGRFDEGFWPAYFEDNDYHRRMNLAGVNAMCVLSDGYDHVGGGTLAVYSAQEMQQHHANFNRNKNRYIAKWGGLPGQETYTTPRS